MSTTFSHPFGLSFADLSRALPDWEARLGEISPQLTSRRLERAVALFNDPAVQEQVLAIASSTDLTADRLRQWVRDLLSEHGLAGAGFEALYQQLEPTVLRLFEPGVLEGEVVEGIDGDDWATTLALGEEGGDCWLPIDDGLITTEAIGEEGGDGWATTLALGEEGGDGWATTRMVGEEGGDCPTGYDDMQMSTRAVGEEGGDKGDDLIRFTTLALGEEGGDDAWPPSDGTPDALGDSDPIIGQPGSEPEFTTLALGEEGGDWGMGSGDEVVTSLALGEEGGATTEVQSGVDPWLDESDLSSGLVLNNGLGYGADPHPGQL
ncbi:MAG: hypothetical protein EA367_07740 [Leptolyngbya sp. DLM2.Bin15]|nr:MAG: hypothetical protein EA367_07740 [Leptolyngbya sp. DLM2.Bin15]